MNKKLLVYLFWAALMVVPSGIFSQDLLTVANKQFQLEAYDLAVLNYKKVLAVHPKNSDAMFHLAEAYRISNKYSEALEQYDQLLKLESFNPLAYLNYGHVLKSMGKFEKAKYWYNKYMDIDETVGRHFAESCDKAAEMLGENEKYEVSLFANNSPNSDFGVTIMGEDIIYCSFRDDILTSKGSLNGDAQNFNANQLFTVQKASSDISYLRSYMVSSFHMGPVSYAGENQELVAYTKNNFKDNVSFVRSDDAHMSLFFADKTENSNDFTQERPFPYNETGYSTGFPSFANNGNTLYFASNRPGGQGGYDIYVTYFRNGSWSQPVNLGDEVNSPGNEITPYFDGNDGRLYFASDFHTGIGGYDIFVSEKLGDIEYGIAINLGKGVNSPSDDYFFTMDGNGKYYFTSNRLGGLGGDDIYTAMPIYDETIAENIPPAVNLDDLAVGTSNVGATTVANNEGNADDYIADNNFSLVDARLFSKGSVMLAPPAKVYFIQVAALYRTKGNMNEFNGLTSYGNLYKVHRSSSTKIRLGYYNDRGEASKILSKVKNMGYNDAFIVEEPLEMSEMELVGNSGSKGSEEFSSNFKPAPQVSSYKVRLASYTDPLWFDISRVKDLGDIEQWTKGQYTIFILSGYGSLENAQTAMIKAKNRGFTEAHIVVDNNGYLEKLKTN